MRASTGREPPILAFQRSREGPEITGTAWSGPRFFPLKRALLTARKVSNALRRSIQEATSGDGAPPSATP